MNPISTSLVHFIDRASFTLQNAFQTFGFLPDGRELVEITDAGAGQRVTFSDHSDEGWEGFSLNVPGEASFTHALQGVLRREAYWWIPLPAQAVAAHLLEYNELASSPDIPIGKSGSFPLSRNAKAQILGIRDGASVLVVSQVRNPENLREAVKARSARSRGRWAGRSA